MAWSAVSSSYAPAQGERVRVIVEPYQFPTVDTLKVQAAVSQAGYDVVKVTKRLFGGYEVEISAPGGQSMREIGEGVAGAINGLWDAWGTVVSGYERWSEPLFTPPSTSTTISLVALAVLALVGFVVATRAKLL
jgi:hypothetical protein